MKTIQEKTEEQIAVMQHFADGGEVEKHYGVDGWEVVFNPAWNWSTQDYRIKQPVDPYAELKAAASDPTKQIRCLDVNCDDDGWYDSTALWDWDFHHSQYEIRDKPMKKVKLLAWFDGAGLYWVAEDHAMVNDWKHVPSKDMEIEVEE